MNSGPKEWALSMEHMYDSCVQLTGGKSKSKGQLGKGSGEGLRAKAPHVSYSGSGVSNRRVAEMGNLLRGGYAVLQSSAI